MNILVTFKLEGKVALVTGANRGLGLAMALGLAEAGADIIGLDRGVNSYETQRQVESLGRRFLHMQFDLATTSIEQLQKTVDQVTIQMGRLDILVNNAGIIRRTPALEFNETDWDDVLQVNLKAAFFLSQASAKKMLKQGGGKIIQIASVLSYQGGIFVPPYAAAKHGIVGVTRALANEWAKHNINVNAIAPGYFETDNTAAIRQDEARNHAILDRIPAGRWGKPDDLKRIVVFLASEASNYIHGAVVPVDRAWLAR